MVVELGVYNLLTLVLLALLSSAVLPVADAYDTGAGSRACSHGYPGGGSSSPTSHGSLQSGNGGYSLSFSPSVSSGYIPGETYDVTLSGSISMAGFLVKATAGTMVPIGNTKTQCGDEGITHSQSLGANSISFQWGAPSAGAGDVTFRSTALDNKNMNTGRFWIFTDTISADVSTTSTPSTTCDSVPVDCAALNRAACADASTPNTCGPCLDGFYEINGNRTAKNTDTCRPCNSVCLTCEDDTRACTECNPGYEKSPIICEAIPDKDFSQGSSLTTPGCTSACPVEAHWGRQGSNMNFKIVIRGFPNVEWAGIGFSSNTQMPSSDIITAHINAEGQVTVVNRWSSTRSRPAEDGDQRGFSGVTGSRNSTALEVEFARQLTPINENDADFSSTDNTYHILVAFGNGDFSKHAATGASGAPIVSSSDINLQDSADVSSANPTNARTATIAHGIVMVTAWIFLSPTATFIAHNLKFVGPTWFLLHKYMQLAAILLTIVGFIIIYVDLEEFQTGTHETLGVLVLAFCLTQGLLGFLRNVISGKPNDPKDPQDHGPRRWIFNYMHWTLGATTTVLAVITVFFGLDKLGAESSAFIVLYVWIAVEATVSAVCLVLRHMSERKTDNYLLEATAVFVAMGAAALITVAALISDTPEFK